MTLAIHELKNKRIGPHEIERFLRAHSFPIVEDRVATFVYHGVAESVELVHWVYGLEQSQLFERVPGTHLWYFVMDLPERSRVEYKIGVTQGGQTHLVRDELNEHFARDPYGANSVVHGAGYEEPDWAFEQEGTRRGSLQSHTIQSAAFGDERKIEVYLPARFRPSRRYPLLIVHDGPDYLRFAALREVLDNLIDRLEIPGMIVALTESPNRLHEYANDERHAQHIVDELLPMLEREYPIAPTANARGLMGASFGAVASLSTAWRNPGVFGRLLLQSGSFAFTDIGHHDRGPVFDPVVEFVNEFRADPGQPTNSLYLSCGMYESLVYYNRSLVPLLQSTGMNVRFTEAPDGHNWENWRDRLREGLSWLFPGPLWMVYE